MTIALELPILAHRSAIGVDVDEVSSKMLGSCLMIFSNGVFFVFCGLFDILMPLFTDTLNVLRLGG